MKCKRELPGIDPVVLVAAGLLLGCLLLMSPEQLECILSSIAI